MSKIGFITDAELDQLIPVDAHQQVAKLLKIQSEARSTELKEQIKRIARAYDSALLLEPRLPSKGRTSASLAQIQNAVRALAEAIDGADGRARSELASSLLALRTLLQAATGERILPYDHLYSNQAMLERMSIQILLMELDNIDRYITEHLTEYKRPGPRPGPESWALREMATLHEILGVSKLRAKDLTTAAQLVLSPIAQRHGETPNFRALIKQLILV